MTELAFKLRARDRQDRGLDPTPRLGRLWSDSARIVRAVASRTSVGRQPTLHTIDCFVNGRAAPGAADVGHAVGTTRRV